MPQRLLERIRRLVHELRYEISNHAWHEMAEDNLLIVDVEPAMLTGHVVNE